MILITDLRHPQRTILAENLIRTQCYYTFYLRDLIESVDSVLESFVLGTNTLVAGTNFFFLAVIH